MTNKTPSDLSTKEAFYDIYDTLLILIDSLYKEGSLSQRRAQILVYILSEGNKQVSDNLASESERPAEVE